jgi:hypothetical protein
MDEKTQLELAAKAVHLNYYWNERLACHEVWRDGERSKRFWQPHRDDGDALRLAVELAASSPGASFTLSISKMHDGRGFADAGFFSRDNPTQQVVDSDAWEATRQAIVLAAAEIGKAMP